MRKDLCPIDLIALDNQMDDFLSHDWPYEKARERAKQERKDRLILRLIDIVGLALLLGFLIVVGLFAGGKW